MDIQLLFLDDYVWENCLDEAFRVENMRIHSEPYIIDQEIYEVVAQGKKHVTRDLGSSQKVFRDYLECAFDDDQSKPISAILGSGGIGKTKLCAYIFNFINQGQRKKAIYINSKDLLESSRNRNVEIHNIYDLYREYVSVTGQGQESLLQPKNLEINMSCGNVVVIIDGLDEIESYYRDCFDLDKFINSLIEVHEYYDRCKIIITAREYHLEKYLKYQDVSIYVLRGFDRKLVEEYFSKRFSDSLKKQKYAIQNTEKLKVCFHERYVPMFLDIISNIVIRESMLDVDYDPDIVYDTNLLRPGKDELDEVLYRMINREITVQKLAVSVDEVVDLLMEIIVSHGNKISYKDFEEYVACVIYGKSDINKTRLVPYYNNPLLICDNNSKKVSVKYDALVSLLKIRYAQRCLREEHYTEALIKYIANDYDIDGQMYKGITDSIEGSYSEVIDKLTKYIAHVRRLITQNDDPNADIEDYKKNISFSLHIAFHFVGFESKKDATRLLLELCGSRLEHIAIYGSFYPLDLTEVEFYRCSFYKYSNISECLFPENKVVFYQCIFEDMNVKGRINVDSKAFAEDCTLQEDMLDLLGMHEVRIKEINNKIKSDLVRFFKSFASSNVFTPKSYNKIQSHYQSKLDRDSFIKETLRFGYIMRRKHERKDLYYINPDKTSGVLSLITQYNMDPEMESFGIMLVKKYYN